eukprot:TRINITY_DN14155_c0_g1_i2.p1 TRINITY_DN14155_c0_g1~~TRINITY_DN14155_c0_g1_i2.p1  ORF type:complete len:326 (-),score=64.14 TRINITY_DN14155_c0_g1_i2:26-1003(-)
MVGVQVLFVSGVLLVGFFAAVLWILAAEPSMFFRKYAQRHRLAGLFHLSWLLFGLVDVCACWTHRVLYNGILGLSGVVLTLTAAFDFKHHKVIDRQGLQASGTLEDSAVVSFSEMIEHSFYQGLNLVQVMTLHTLVSVHDWRLRSGIVLLATSPWLVRPLFPVNSFSKNYTKQGADPYSLISVLYRLKKYQYLLYKHMLLHGLNISAALHWNRGSSVTEEAYFQLYWISLNTSYVMEFFLQTLVRKKVLQQSQMLGLQHVLMGTSTLLALCVVVHVDLLTAALSLVLNLVHRHHEFANTSAVLLFALWLQSNGVHSFDLNYIWNG